MFTANFNRLDNYDVHSAENPVTRVIATVYGDKTANFSLVWMIEMDVPFFPARPVRPLRWV